MSDSLLLWLQSHMNALTLFGFFGQGLFMMRFVAQWLYSEKMKRSAIPVVFWYFSIAGGLTILIYAFLKNDLVIMTGQMLGIIIYVRNLVLISRAKKAPEDPELAELASRANDLLSRAQKGDDLLPVQRLHAIEALHILQGIGKEDDR